MGLLYYILLDTAESGPDWLVGFAVFMSESCGMERGDWILERNGTVRYNVKSQARAYTLALKGLILSLEEEEVSHVMVATRWHGPMHWFTGNWRSTKASTAYMAGLSEEELPFKVGFGSFPEGAAKGSLIKVMPRVSGFKKALHTGMIKLGKKQSPKKIESVKLEEWIKDLSLEEDGETDGVGGDHEEENEKKEETSEEEEEDDKKDGRRVRNSRR